MRELMEDAEIDRLRKAIWRSYHSSSHARDGRHRGRAHGTAERRRVLRLLSVVDQRGIAASSPKSIERGASAQDVGALGRGAARSTDRPGPGAIYRLCSSILQPG